MPYVPLRLPPGIVKPGTAYDARGRWYNGNLIRWYSGVLQPVGGWTPMRTTTPSAADVNIAAPARGAHAWRDSNFPILALGTYTKLWLYRGGLLSDISPAALVTGRIHAEEDITTGGTYGSGAYGAGPYGTGVEGLSQLLHPTTWQLDNFGAYLVACSTDDGRLLWQTDPSSAAAAVAIPNAPTNNRGVVVTPERFIVALGADGDARKVQWCDQENGTAWASTSTNQAGEQILATPGVLLAGRRGPRETLIWTDVDLWRMQYIGGELVYSFTQAGSQCGAISPNAMAMAGGKAFWMANKTFYVYDGFARPIESEVADYVFSSINQLQRHKVSCFLRSQYNEVAWHYPSSGSAENDRYVTYNYVEDHWTVGELQRTTGVDSSVFGFPIAADASGNVFQHEIAGGEYAAGAGTLTPFIESGPVELGEGDPVFMVREIVPDTNTLGAVTMSLFASLNPNASETLHGPYSLSAPTKVRLTARQVRLRIRGEQPNWRVGTVRLEVAPGSTR